MVQKHNQAALRKYSHCMEDPYRNETRCAASTLVHAPEARTRHSTGVHPLAPTRDRT